MTSVLEVKQDVLFKKNVISLLSISENNKYLAIAGHFNGTNNNVRCELVIFNLEIEKLENRLILENQITAIDWAGNNAVVIADNSGSVHLLL